VKQITNISLGPEEDNYKIETKFLGKKFKIQRIGTDGDINKAEDLLLKWNKKAAAICLSGFKFPYTIGSQKMPNRETSELLELCSQLQTPVTTGETLRGVSQEWCIRHLQFQLGNNYFTNARVLFFSGMTSATIAKVISEYTENLTFVDPILMNGIPKYLNSLNELKLYADKIYEPLKWIPGKKLSSIAPPVKAMNDFLMRKAIKKSTVIVLPHYEFFKYLDHYAEGDLEGKVVITSAAYDDRVQLLTEKGTDVIIDTTPKVLNKVVSVGVIEALMVAALDIPKGDEMKDDLLEIISEQRMDPRVIFPSGEKKRINRFAYIVHPLSRDFLKKLKPIEAISEVSPGSLGAIEKVMAYSPPFVYSKVTGIKSATGVEAEGWLIAITETPEQMQAHDPEFTRKKILQAAKIAKNLGAQIMGIGMLPKTMHKASIDVAKSAVLPVTTGNNYIASTALWAAAEAVRQMGLTKLKKGKILRAKTMVIGATGAVGAICSRLLATAFEEVHMVSRNMAKLLTIQETVQKEAPNVKVHVSTRADTHIGDMDVIVAAASGAGQILDIMMVKPGCVITDITRPMIFSKEEVAKRPDVLVIRGGEILLPGENVEMKDIGLPPQVAYAGLAETVTLALEGRFEVFTVGSETEWEKVKEIYKLGLKHGMKLATISGINGVFSEEDIARVKALAVKERKKK